MKIKLPVALVLGVLALGAAIPAAAQTPDSVIAASHGGQSLFRVNVDGGAVLGGAWDGGTSSGGIPREGAGTRMIWHPRKGAFRAGHVVGTQWDEPNVGYFSVAIGHNVRASGDGSVALGVRSIAAGSSTFAAGEDNTASGAASVALGYHAHTNARQGSFVFGDRSTVDTIRAGVNHSANWRVSGGFRVFTSSNLSTGVTIQSGASTSNWGQTGAVISTSTGAFLSTGGDWTNASDVNRKHLFADASGEEILARLRGVPIRSWSYRTEDDEVRHLGPTAQDFRAAFGLGRDSVSISTIDANGVALAGVQALESRTRRLDAENRALREEVAALREELTVLHARQAEQESRLQRLEAAIGLHAAGPQALPEP